VKLQCSYYKRFLPWLPTSAHSPEPVKILELPLQRVKAQVSCRGSIKSDFQMRFCQFPEDLLLTGGTKSQTSITSSEKLQVLVWLPQNISLIFSLRGVDFLMQAP